VRALITRISCAVGMRNAKLRNHLKYVVCSFIINVWASETSMFRGAAESAKRMVRLSGGCWALKSEVSREPICHEDLVNVGKLQQVFLYLFTNYADKTSSVNPGLYHPLF